MHALDQTFFYKRIIGSWKENEVGGFVVFSQ